MDGGRHFAAGSTLPVLPNDGKLVLYSMRFCLFAQRVHLVLDAKDIPYYTVYVNLTEKPEWLAEKSPLLKVPALEIPCESDPLIESVIICEYLDDQYPEVRLQSVNPIVKARDNVLIDRINVITAPLYAILSGQTEEIGEILTSLRVSLRAFEEELKNRGTKYFNGDEHPGMVDYMFWPWYERIEVIPLYIGDKFNLSREGINRLMEWSDAMKKDKAVKKSLIFPEIHKMFMDSRSAGNPNYNLMARADDVIHSPIVFYG